MHCASGMVNVTTINNANKPCINTQSGVLALDVCVRTTVHIRMHVRNQCMNACIRVLIYVHLLYVCAKMFSQCCEEAINGITFEWTT